MTTQLVLEKVREFKEISESTLLRYLKKAEIKPRGDFRTRPQDWPEDTPERLKLRMGYANGHETGKAVPLPSSKELRAITRKAKAKKGAK